MQFRDIGVFQGGKFWAGFAAGAVSSIASSFWQGSTNTTAGLNGERIAIPGTGFAGIGTGTGAIGTLAFASIAGGAGSALAGGNFWQGAVTGLIVSGFNHLMHDDDGIDSTINDEANQGNPKPRVKPSSYTPKPKKVPDGALKLRPKGGRPRYRLPDGDIIEWDGQHAEWERYDPRGKHTGVLNPDGELIKARVKGRTITPFSSPYKLPQFQMPDVNWKAVGIGVGIGILLIVTDGLAAPLLVL